MAVAAFCASPAQSHHGFEGRYDISRPLWIEGQVTSAAFGPPHAVISIRTPSDLAAPASPPELGGAASYVDTRRIEVDPASRGRVVRIELPPTSNFNRLSSSIQVGSRIAVVAIRNCLAPHQMYAQWAQPAGGEAAVQSLRLRFMVEGC